jgi:glycosyltransferase involved in cell wall biosynthesis
MVKVSVIIAAYNRPDLLEDCFKALAKQTYKDFEVLSVVGHSKEVLELSQKYAKKYKNFNAFKTDSDSPSRKRNVGIKKAKGELIAFTDDDCLPRKDWVENIVREFKISKEIVMVEGYTYTNNTNRPVFSNAPENHVGGAYPTCNLSFRKDVLKKTHGFDESYYFFREDSDAAFAAMDYGKTIFSKKVRVFHPLRPTNKKSIIKQVFLHKEDFRLYKKFPKKFKEAFGFPLKRELTKSLMTYIFLIMGIVYFQYWYAFLVVYLIVRFSSLRRYKFNLTDFTSFVVLWFARDLMMPFVAAYYFLKFYAKLK